MPLERIKLAVTASSLGNDVRQAPTVSRTLGFRGLQFDAYSSSFNIPDLSGSGRREFSRLLSTQDQKCVGLRVDLGTKGFGPGADVDRLLEQLDRVLETAASLMAPLVCLDIGYVPTPARIKKSRPAVTPEMAGMLILPSSSTIEVALEPATPAPDPAFVSRVDSALAELGRKADRYSVIVAFRSDLASFAAIERAIDAARCPWFGLDLDPAAVQRDEWTIEDVLARLGSQIRHVRGRDATGGENHRAKPAVVGSGSTDWGTLLSNLDAAGYHGWLTVDPTELMDRINAAETGRKWLTAFLTD